VFEDNFQSGDVIYAVNREPVKDVQSLREVLRRFKPAMRWRFKLNATAGCDSSALNFLDRNRRFAERVTLLWRHGQCGCRQDDR